MNNERIPEEAGINDPGVSSAYAEIANERAPASLNERVLRDASRHAGKGYSYWMVWMRPMAWAATVGLCLAIVLELSSVTQPEQALFESLPAAGADKPAEEKRRVATPAVDRVNAKAEASEQPAAPARSNDVVANEQPVTPARSNDTAANGNQAPGAITVQSARPEAPATERDDAAGTDLFQIREAPILKDAEDMARMRQGSEQVAEERTLGGALAVRSEATILADVARCDEQARATPESWVDCIEELAEAGHNTDAEHEALLAAHPDYEIP